jgi:hypothetical protein
MLSQQGGQVALLIQQWLSGNSDKATPKLLQFGTRRLATTQAAHQCRQAVSLTERPCLMSHLLKCKQWRAGTLLLLPEVLHVLVQTHAAHEMKREGKRAQGLNVRFAWCFWASLKFDFVVARGPHHGTQFRYARVSCWGASLGVASAPNCWRSRPSFLASLKDAAY